jgi:hypothetical protein
MKGRVAKPEKRHAQHKLTKSEEESLIQYIIDLDARGFPPRVSGVEDMADLLLTRPPRITRRPASPATVAVCGRRPARSGLPGDRISRPVRPRDATVTTRRRWRPANPDEDWSAPPPRKSPPKL